MKEENRFSKAEFFTYDEGLCVQCMHIGPYDDEPKTVEQIIGSPNSRAIPLRSPRSDTTMRSISAMRKNCAGKTADDHPPSDQKTLKKTRPTRRVFFVL